MLSGRNNKYNGTMTGRLQLNYQEKGGLWHPYFAVGVSPMELPLHNKQISTLSITQLNFSFSLGLNREIRSNERSVWTVGGGIGICMLRPDGATLYLEGNQTTLGYSALTDNAWFPQLELTGRWITYPSQYSNWYLGMQMVVSGIWLRDTKARYTTNIAGTSYSLSLNDSVIWPSLGGIVGYRF